MPDASGSLVRKYPRMNAEYVVGYRRSGEGGSPGPLQLAKTRSVGLGGVMFATEKPLTPGERLDVDLIADGRTIGADAQVVYVEPAADGWYENGVAFTRISESDREHLLGCFLRQEYMIPSEEPAPDPAP